MTICLIVSAAVQLLLQLKLGFHPIHQAFNRCVISSGDDNRAATGLRFGWFVAAAFVTDAIQYDFVIAFETHDFVTRIRGSFFGNA